MKRLAFINDPKYNVKLQIPPPPPPHSSTSQTASLSTSPIKNLSLLDMHQLFFESKIPKDEKHPHPNEVIQNDNETSYQQYQEQQEPNPNMDLVFQFSKIRQNIEMYNHEFRTNRKVKIIHPLNPVFAESIYQHVIKMPDSLWSVACGIRNIKYEKKLLNQYQKRNQDNINEAVKTFSKGEFSYVFHRAMNNVVGEISQFESIMRAMLNSPIFIQLLCEITGLQITQLRTMFLSRYRSGHFLSPHSDKGNGKIAFVINLSKNWLPQYGGNLHFLSEDRQTIIETWTPAFNNMVIFYVPPEHEADCGMPHFVGHVNPNVRFSRYAITGWYE